MKFLNDGTGKFTKATSEIFPDNVTGNGFDSEAADYNGDGKIDLYLCSRGGTDKLLLHK